jgi:hypothetical protein
VLLLGNEKLNQTSEYLLLNASPEIQEAERYYKNEMEAKIKLITHLENTDNTLLSDLEELNVHWQNIQKDIDQNPTDSRVVSAVLNTYIAQIEWLDGLIEQKTKLNAQL